jgi:hypothetical protein
MVTSIIASTAANTPWPRPPGVARWVNLADAGGVVAVPEDLPAWFVGIGHLTVEAILAHLNLVPSGAGGVRARP